MTTSPIILWRCWNFPGAMGIIIGSALNPDGNKYRSFTVSGTKGTITLEPIEPGDLFLDLKAAAGPYPKGKHQIKTGPYVRFEDDFKEFAAAIRDGKPLSVSPMEDLMVQEAVIEASGMEHGTTKPQRVSGCSRGCGLRDGSTGRAHASIARATCLFPS